MSHLTTDDLYNYLVERNGTVPNAQFMKDFRPILKTDQDRSHFMKLVNKVASVKSQDGQKFIKLLAHLRPKNLGAAVSTSNLSLAGSSFDISRVGGQYSSYNTLQYGQMGKSQTFNERLQAQNIPPNSQNIQYRQDKQTRQTRQTSQTSQNQRQAEASYRQATVPPHQSSQILHSNYNYNTASQASNNSNAKILKNKNKSQPQSQTQTQTFSKTTYSPSKVQSNSSYIPGPISDRNSQSPRQMQLNYYDHSAGNSSISPNSTSSRTKSDTPEMMRGNQVSNSHYRGQTGPVSSTSGASGASSAKAVSDQVAVVGPPSSSYRPERNSYDRDTDNKIHNFRGSVKAQPLQSSLLHQKIKKSNISHHREISEDNLNLLDRYQAEASASAISLNSEMDLNQNSKYCLSNGNSEQNIYSTPSLPKRPVRGDVDKNLKTTEALPGSYSPNTCSSHSQLSQNSNHNWNQNQNQTQTQNQKAKIENFSYQTPTQLQQVQNVVADAINIQDLTRNKPVSHLSELNARAVNAETNFEQQETSVNSSAMPIKKGRGERSRGPGQNSSLTCNSNTVPSITVQQRTSAPQHFHQNNVNSIESPDKNKGDNASTNLINSRNMPSAASIQSESYSTSQHIKWSKEKSEWFNIMTSYSVEEIKAFLDGRQQENILTDDGVNNFDLINTLVNSTDSLHGYNLLHHAVVRGEVELIQLALRYIDLNSVTDMTENTALHLAVKGHKLDLVELLIRQGASKDKRNYLGERPFDLIKSSNRYLFKSRGDEFTTTARKMLF